MGVVGEVKGGTTQILSPALQAVRLRSLEQAPGRVLPACIEANWSLVPAAQAKQVAVGKQVAIDGLQRALCETPNSTESH